MDNFPRNDGQQPSSPQRDPDTVLPVQPVQYQGAPQLPPQMFTTAAQLLDLTDKKLVLVLRDGRKLIGVLRSWDQFANLVLTNTKERYFVTIPASTSPSANSQAQSQYPLENKQQPRRLYCDIERGTYLVRGENVLILGEVDLDKDDEAPPGYEEGPAEDVFNLQTAAEEMRKKKDKSRIKKATSSWGGELENSGEVLF